MLGFGEVLLLLAVIAILILAGCLSRLITRDKKLRNESEMHLDWYRDAMKRRHLLYQEKDTLIDWLFERGYDVKQRSGLAGGPLGPMVIGPKCEDREKRREHL